MAEKEIQEKGKLVASKVEEIAVLLAENATLAVTLKLRVEEVAAKNCKIEQLEKSFEDQAAMLMQLEEEKKKLESSSRVASVGIATLAVTLKLRVEELAANNCKIEQLEKSFEEQAAKLMQLEEEKKKLESLPRDEIVGLFLEKMAATQALDVSNEENLKHKSRIEELQACIEEKQRKLREAVEEKCLLFKTNSELNKIVEGYNRVFDEIKKREEEIQQMRKGIKDENERILGRIDEVSNKAQIIAKNAENLKAKKKEKKILKIFRRRR